MSGSSYLSSSTKWPVGNLVEVEVTSLPVIQMWVKNQRLFTHPFVVFGVEFSEVNGDFVQFGLVNTVSRGGHVPMVQQHSAALVARYPDMHLKKMKMKVFI